MCVFDAGNLSLDDDLCALGKIGQVYRPDCELSLKRGRDRTQTSVAAAKYMATVFRQ